MNIPLTGSFQVDSDTQENRNLSVASKMLCLLSLLDLAISIYFDAALEVEAYGYITDILYELLMLGTLILVRVLIESAFGDYLTTRDMVVIIVLSIPVNVIGSALERGRDSGDMNFLWFTPYSIAISSIWLGCFKMMMIVETISAKGCLKMDLNLYEGKVTKYNKSDLLSNSINMIEVVRLNSVTINRLTGFSVFALIYYTCEALATKRNVTLNLFFCVAAFFPPLIFLYKLESEITKFEKDMSMRTNLTLGVMHIKGEVILSAATIGVTLYKIVDTIL